jgi:carboxypeptidase family protein/TonB-dependent receptor-like protein
MKKNKLWLKLTAWSMILFAGAMSLPGQIGRGTITGIVHDPTGATAAAVSVSAVNTATGVAFQTTTNEGGTYTIGALPPGEYTVRFKASGFKEAVRQHISLDAGTIARVDPTLELGAVSDQVQVTAEAPLLETETAQNSESVTSKVFSGLPLGFGGGRNMAVFADRLVPGVNGAGYGMRIQGTPGGSAGVLVDGMTNLAGFLPGDFAEASISPEAIQELNVFTGNVSAEMGRQSGGTMNFTLKSGTNQPHGTAFYYLRNEIFNANDWNNNLRLAADPNFSNAATANFVRPRDRRKDYGASFGGPVYIPRIYDGRNKTFFYFTAERFNNSTRGPGNLNWTVPQPEMWRGNLSRLLTGRQVGTDGMNRPVMEGQIYDPSTLRRLENGRYIADPFLGNIIPTSRISRVAQKYAGIFDEWYQPATTSLLNNSYDNRINKQDVKQYTLKADHAFSPNHKVSGYYYKHGFPRNFLEGASQVFSLKDPDLGGPLSRIIRQQRRGYNWNVGYDWVVSPTMLNHAMVGLNWNGNAFQTLHRGKEQIDALGISGLGFGQPESEWTNPVINLGSSPVATFQSWGLSANRDEFYRAYVIGDTLSWQKGAHSLKFGFEYNNLNYKSQQYNNTGGTFNFASRTTAIPGETFTNNIGNSFASLLLGQVDSANLGPVFIPVTSRYYAAAFVQDSWKATSRLTLNFGLRWSGNSSYFEKEDRLANFNPSLPDPGNGGRLGAVEYMGEGQGRTGRRTIFPGNWRDFGPTLGLAFRVTNRVAMRGGYGISFTPEGFGWTFPWWAGFNQTNSVPVDSKGTFLPVFNIDNGYAGQTVGPDLDPSYAAKFGGARRYSPNFAKAGYVQNFNLGFQGQLRDDLVLEIDWRGSTGVRLHAAGLVSPNQINPRELSRGAVLTQTINTPADAAAAGLQYPYAGFSGLGAFTLLPFPQLKNQGISGFGDTLGYSTYHSLNFIGTKRMSKGIFFYGAYTFSKVLTNVTDVVNGGGGAGIQDAYNISAFRAVASDDRTHVLKSAFTLDLPFGKGRALLGNAGGVLNALVGGWNVSASMRHRSGTPLGHPNSRTRPNFWNGPTVWANFNTPSGGFERVFNPSTFNPWNAADPGNRMFDRSAFSDASPQSLGTSPNRFPQVRTPWDLSEDMTILKRFSITERASLQLRMELLNVFNRHYFGGVDLDMNSASFGNIRTASGFRTGQLGARIEW